MYRLSGTRRLEFSMINVFIFFLVARSGTGCLKTILLRGQNVQNMTYIVKKKTKKAEDWNFQWLTPVIYFDTSGTWDSKIKF